MPGQSTIERIQNSCQHNHEDGGPNHHRAVIIEARTTD
jgi:hypothetical protein